MYYEVKEVSKYARKNKKTGHKTPIVQINLTKESKFEKGQTVAVVDLETLENELNNIDSDELEKLRVKCDGLETENQELREKLKNVPDMLETAEIHKHETNKLNTIIREKDDTIKSLLVAYMELYGRGLIDRVRNTTPQSYEVIERLQPTPELILNEKQQDE